MFATHFPIFQVIYGYRPKRNFLVLIPAARVIPVPIAYIKFVAVKKLVVEIEERDGLKSMIDRYLVLQSRVFP